MSHHLLRCCTYMILSNPDNNLVKKNFYSHFQQNKQVKSQRNCSDHRARSGSSEIQMQIQLSAADSILITTGGDKNFEIRGNPTLTQEISKNMYKTQEQR